MRNKLLIWALLGALLAPLAPLYAALPAATTWEVRPPSTGSDNNGGCFVTGASGTDFSQQDAAQYTFTDLVLVTTTTATSASHAFVAADVGNCLRITAGTGFTTGFYQIVSVAASTATLDRAAGTGGSTGGTYAVGGAIANVSTANTNLTSGNTVYVKATGTYTVTATMTVNLSNNVGAVSFIGYTTTRGDNGRFTWTTATNSTPLIAAGGSSPANYLFQNIAFTNTAGTRDNAMKATSSNGFSWVVNNCSFDGFSVAINGDFSVVFAFQNMFLVNSEIKNSTSHGIFNSAGMTIAWSYIHDNTGDGLRNNSNGGLSYNHTHVQSSIFKSNGGKGINMTANGTATTSRTWTVLSSDFISNTSDGIALTSTVGINGIIANSIFDSNGGFGINASQATGAVVSLSNAFRSNTSGARNNWPASPTSVPDVTLTANPFTNTGTNDFSLNSTAGGGTACKGVGFPGALAIGGTGHLDIGALQSAASALTSRACAIVQ